MHLVNSTHADTNAQNGHAHAHLVWHVCSYNYNECNGHMTISSAASRVCVFGVRSVRHGDVFVVVDVVDIVISSQTRRARE